MRSAPHASYSAGLQSQIRLLPFLAVNAGVTAEQAMRYDEVVHYPGGSTTPLTIKPNGSISPYVGLLVPLVPQHLVGEVQYQHAFLNDDERSSSVGETRFLKQSNNAFTARVLFAFGGAPAVMPAPASVPPPLVPAPEEAKTYLVFFDWDRADLTARARQIVGAAAQTAMHGQTTRIEVDGYTDLSGTAAYNQRLSVRRARSVEAELVRDGVSAGEIAVHGYGESRPLVPTAAGVREPQNRRVEILLK